MPDGPSTSRTYQVLRPHHLRDVNEIAVLRYLIAHGPTPRLEIAHEIGLTQGSITRIVARLVERGLLREAPRRDLEAVRGRPKVPVEVVADAYAVIGAHVGLEHLTLGTTGIDGEPRLEARVDHHGRWDEVEAAVGDFVEEVRATTRTPVLGLGLIVGGLVDPGRGVLRTHGPLGWSEVAMRADLEKRLPHAVFVDSSARAHADADIVFGAADGARSFVHVFVGNLIEVAVVADGRVQPGRDGRGGDVSGWTIARPDGTAIAAEHLITDGAVLARARASGLIGPLDGLDALVRRARDPESGSARLVLLDRAAAVGHLLAELDALLAPELIVLSSGVLAIDGTLETAAEAMRTARFPVPPPPLRASRHGSNPLVTAAAALVLRRTLLSSSAEA